MSEHLHDYPVTIEIPVAWGEMDAFRHVNNTVYFRYFESVRMVYFERIGLLDILCETGVGPILATTRCDFKFPLTYPDRVDVGTRVSEIGEDRFTMMYHVFSQQAGRTAARGEGVIVSYDYGAGGKCPLPDAARERIRALQE